MSADEKRRKLTLLLTDDQMQELREMVQYQWSVAPDGKDSDDLEAVLNQIPRNHEEVPYE